LIKITEILSKFPRIKCLYELNIFLKDTLNTTKHSTKIAASMRTKVSHDGVVLAEKVAPESM